MAQVMNDEALKALQQENEKLRRKLQETEDICWAIRNGEVDAFVVSDGGNDRVYTLSSADRTYRLLIEHMSQGALILNTDGMISYCNQYAGELLGTPPQKIIGTPLRTFVSPQSQKQFENLASLCQTGGSHGEMVLLPAGGKPLTALLTFNPLPKGEVFGICVIVIDLTEQKDARMALQSAHDLLEGRVSHNAVELAKANAILNEEIAERKLAEVALRQSEERLRRLADALSDADRRKDEFLAVVSHELRTPLTAMQAWTHMLRTKKLDPAQAQRGIEVIERNIKVQTQLVEDLLDVSRIVTGKLNLKFMSVDFAKVIREALDSVRPTAESKSIEIVSNPDKVWIAGDPDRLHQIIWNLVSNAIKFTPKGGRITIDLQRMDSRCRLRISDNGIGIPATLMPVLFHRFSQGDASTTRQFGGLGLGLSIVQHLVEAHGGTVNVESAGTGKGSAFSVELPIPATAMTMSDSDTTLPAVAVADLAGLRVMAVDDNPDSLDMIKVVLEAAGADVLAVGSAEHALAELVRHRPDILVSDIGMPEMDGYQLIKSIRSLPDSIARIPALALTAYARQEEHHRALEAGFTCHIAKPIEPSELTSIVGRLGLRRKAAQLRPSEYES